MLLMKKAEKMDLTKKSALDLRISLDRDTSISYDGSMKNNLRATGWINMMSMVMQMCSRTSGVPCCLPPNPLPVKIGQAP
jgi:hypothetical protein